MTGSVARRFRSADWRRERCVEDVGDTEALVLAVLDASAG